KTHTIRRVYAERRTSNARHSAFFQHDAAHLFGAEAGVFDVDPCVKRAFRWHAAEPWNTIQVARELFTPARELLPHALGCTLGIAQSFNRTILSKLRNTGVAVDCQHLQCVHDRRRGNRITEPPSGHGKAL